MSALAVEVDVPRRPLLTLVPTQRPDPLADTLARVMVALERIETGAAADERTAKRVGSVKLADRAQAECAARAGREAARQIRLSLGIVA